MPRKTKSTANAGPPLVGVFIALSGGFHGHTQASIEANFITPTGAALNKSVMACTTHLVASEADYSRPSAKVKSAQNMRIHIVKFEWLEACLTSNTHVKEGPYSHSLKRDAQADEDEDEDEDEDALPSKKKAKTIFEGPKEKETKVAERNVVKHFDAKIPVDEYALLDRSLSRHNVFIDDDDGTIYDASLNLSHSSNNNNKFYRIQILRDVYGDFKTWTRWGRVGDIGQHKTLGDGSREDAMAKFEAKFKEKSGLKWADRNEPPKPNKYAFIEKSYEDDSEDDDEDTKGTDAGVVKKEDEPESKLPKPTQELMQLIFDPEYWRATMTALNYDAQKLPLGKLSTNTISQGFQALKELSELIADPARARRQHGASLSQVQEDLSNTYFTLIPHCFGRARPPVINTKSQLDREIELLASLSDMKDATLLLKKQSKSQINELDSKYRGLGMNEMTPLPQDGEEFNQLKDYLLSTKGSTHQFNFTVAQIFRIEREGEKERFESALPARGDRRLLWHGSRVTNFGGILSQGLRIAPPEAPVSGYMFGKGIYLADMSSKSAQYCCASITNGHAILLLCEAELGEVPQKLIHAQYTAAEDAKEKGLISTLGRGRTAPLKWKDAQCIHPSLKGVSVPDVAHKPDTTDVPNADLYYNEYICYNVNQVRLRYLFKLRL